MKRLMFFLIILVVPYFSKAQSTEITPGTVLPQMTSSQRTHLASPKNGMLVFDTNTQSYWYMQSGSWVELPKGGSTSNYWKLEGTGGNVIKNTNSGGFWSANPTGLTIYSNSTSNPPTAPVNGDGTRLMWIPSRSAFRAGTVYGGNKAWDSDSIGLFSFATGLSTKALGMVSTAMGESTKASGIVSTAMGSFTTASGEFSTAMGYSTRASGEFSTAMGNSTTAGGKYSTAMGYSTRASGDYTTTMGYFTTASGKYSTAMGSRASTNDKEGSFVIGDGYTGSSVLNSNETNRFSSRFRNGYYLYTNATATVGARLLANATSWATISDSTLKENFVASNTEQVLNSISQMRIGTWNYKGQDPTQFRHWGVMAQDFYKHFGKDKYGTIGNDTTIATGDFDGVSFAAIKGLEQRTRELKEALRQAQSDREELKMKNEKLQAEIKELKKDRAFFASEISFIRQQLGLNSPGERRSDK